MFHFQSVSFFISDVSCNAHAQRGSYNRCLSHRSGCSIETHKNPWLMEPTASDRTHKSSQAQSSVFGSQTLLAHSSGPCAHPPRQYDNNVQHQSSGRNTFSACSPSDTSPVEMGIPQACFTQGHSLAGYVQLSCRLVIQATSQPRGVALEPAGCTTDQGPLCHGIGGHVCQQGGLCYYHTATCGSHVQPRMVHWA